MEPETDASTRRVYGGLAPNDEGLAQVDRPEVVLGQALEDVAAAVDQVPVLEAAVPGDRARAGVPALARWAPDQDPTGGEDRGCHARGRRQLEAGDDRRARLRPQPHRAGRDAHVAKRVVQPEGALDRRFLPARVGRRDHPAPAAERLILGPPALRGRGPGEGVAARLARVRLA